MIRSDLALAALATAAVPGMRPVQVAGIRTGEENPLHQSALVEDVTGRTWLVRAPLGAAAGAELERNDELIRQLGKHLPFKVPAAAGYADLGPDGRAAVFPYVEGQGLSLRHLPVGPGLTHAVGRALAAIHNMPRALFEEHAVPVFDAAEFRARKLIELDRAAETGHVPNGLLARWEQALDADAMWEFVSVPTHGSLDGSSFLVVFAEDDAASGRVVGITGWERAQVADPAEDFARLVQQSHPHAVDAVFESYSMARGQRPDGYLLHRARLASEMRLLSGLVAAIGTDDQSFVRTRADQLRKLDRLTTNDNSLVPRTAVTPTEDTRPEAATTQQDGTDGPAEVPAEDAVANGTPTDDTGTDDSSTDVTVTAPVPTPVDVEEEPAAPEGESLQESAAVAEESDDEPAFVVEEPAEGVHLEPVRAPDSPEQDEAPASPTDVTAPIPRLSPEPSADQQGDSIEATAQDTVDPAEADHDLADDDVTDSNPDSGAAPEAEIEGDGDTAPETEAEAEDAEGEQDAAASEQERLHTLYGMPDEDDDEIGSGRS